MKVAKKDVLLLIALVGVLVAVCAYFLVYRPYTEKTATMRTENAQLKVRVDELQVLKDNEQQYIDETAAMKAENEEILNRFPSDVRSEDMIMLATEMGYAAPAVIVDTAMKDPVDLYHIGAKAAEAAAAEAAAAAAAEAAAADGTAPAATTDAATATADAAATDATAAPEQILYGRQLSIGLRGPYSSVKNCIKYIYDNTERRVIGAMNATYDQETGYVQVQLDTALYYVTGTGKEYIEPILPFIPQGKDDIFGALEGLPEYWGSLEEGYNRDTEEEDEE